MSTHPLSSWPYAESPFHDGERTVQQRLGMAEKLETAGRRVIRDFMPDQHREFFTALPFVVAGSVDRNGQPWASVLYGEAGFMTSPDPRHLEVRGHLPAGDPLSKTLVPQAAIGLLGIEPHTRRRNRVNGTVEQVDAGYFRLRVNRSFGNCPKYIQARMPRLVEDKISAPVIHQRDELDARMRRLIAATDTFFIATAVAQENSASAVPHGADVSHRGGKPGFVRIDGADTLTVPDFVGNFFFNTLGNLVANPRAGLLFMDYDNGDLLYLATDAEIIWDGDEVHAFPGAQRLLRFRVRHAILAERAWPLRWSEAVLSPALAGTGSWNGNDRR